MPEIPTPPIPTVKPRRRLTRRERWQSWTEAMAPYVTATLSGQRRRILAPHRAQMVLDAPNAIDEYLAVDLGGVPQWLRIRGHDTANPVLLYLHGGPGGTTLPLFQHCLLPWESHFTVVQWEQRGAGRSFSRGLDRDAMTVDQLTADACELVAHLCARFDQQRIVLLGHSWGSCLGVHALHRLAANGRDEVAAYVGVGQVVDLIESERLGYEHALQNALRTNNDKAREQLEAIAPYPGLDAHDHQKRDVARFWARYYSWMGADVGQLGRNRGRLMETADYSIRDIYSYLAGTLLSQQTLGTQLGTDQSIQPGQLETSFNVPFFLYCGRADSFTPTPLVERYFERLSAPEKRFRTFEFSDHWPMEDEGELFLAALLEDVLPHVTPATPTTHATQATPAPPTTPAPRGTAPSDP